MAPMQSAAAPSAIKVLPRAGTPTRAIDVAIVAALRSNNFARASLLANAGLKAEPSRSSLPVLNALAYEGLSITELDKAALAEQGFRLAIKFDPASWVARYLLGRHLLGVGDWHGAHAALSEALLLHGNDPDILYALGVASYYGQAVDVAAVCADQLLAREGNSLRALQLGIFAAASVGDTKTAAARAAVLVPRLEPNQRQEMAARLADWQRVFRADVSSDSSSSFISAIFDGQPVKQLRAQFAPDNGQQSRTDTDGVTGDKMVIVDVVIIGTEENTATSVGLNLLNNLAIQFGDFGRPAAQATWRRERGNVSAGSAPGDNLVVTAALSIPAVSYSLNIANAASDRSEVLARPSLVAIDGRRSSFFSGLQIQAAAVAGGAYGGSPILIEKDIGITLAVTPAFLAENRFRLVVEAERTFLRPPSSSVEFSYRLETSKTKINATIVLNFGETLILSGLSEKETGRTRSGVPGLQSIPGLQYLFSRKTTNDFQKSVLILLTPRQPQFTYSDSASVANSEVQPATALRDRYPDWFKPYPNAASIFRHLGKNELYREFRTGDVTLDVWRDVESFDAQLKQFLGFLYF